MKNQIIIIVLPVITLVCGFVFNKINTSEFRTYENPGITYTSDDTTKFDQDKAIEKLRKEIAGKEDRPASEVFENIKVFEKVPADRLLRIMEMGFAKSLGVNCTHCHNPNNWSSDEKPQKQIAREMMQMVGKINGELLVKIENLESENPAVNCTTCHRGDVKPALNLNK